MSAEIPADLVLVVEDNPANQRLVSALLRRAGCDVLVADSAAAARTALMNDLPDAILMDIQLPDQDGLSFTRELRSGERTSRIPVIALTALAMRGDEDLALEAGCLGYVTKPIDTRTFAGIVSSILHRAARAADPQNHPKA